MKKKALIMIAIITMALVSCGGNGKKGSIKPISEKITGPLGAYFEVVSKDYVPTDRGNVSIELRRVQAGFPEPWNSSMKVGYSDGCFEPLFTAEFQDENGNTLSKDKTDIVWDKDELVSLAALLVDESCTIGFEMNNEKASRVKLSSTFEVHESSPSSVLNEDDFGETVHHFVGKVAGSNVHLSMNIDGSSVLGRYYYDSQRKKGNKSSMKFFGEKDDDSLELTEFFTDHPTGQFEGDWREGVYKGTFTRAKDGKTFDFELVETDGGEEFFTEEELAFEIPDFEVDINLDFGFSDSGSTDWDEVLDEYEKFVNSYVSFVNKASNGNVTALAEYAEMLEKAEEFSSKLDSAKGDMSTAQMNRLLKLENKMASVATKAAGLMNKMDDLDLDDLLNDATNGLFDDGVFP